MATAVAKRGEDAAIARQFRAALTISGVCIGAFRDYIQRYLPARFPGFSMTNLFLLLVGLALLVAGGDILIRGAVGLAENLRIPAMVIGMTIVAFGTSAPELLVSVAAGYAGTGGIAIGNVVGSNIANILLILAVPALIAATKLEDDGLAKNIAIMLGATMVFMFMLWRGQIGHFSGIILLLLFALFVWDQIRIAQAHRNEKPAHDYHDDIGEAPHSMPVIVTLIVLGLIMLPIGADFTVDGASGIAKVFGISDEVIGLTVVAIGTSLPELAASLLAVWRNNAGVAVGNIVGSNVFNILAIMGVTTTLFPITVAPRVYNFDMWVMAAAAVLVAVLAYAKIDIGKRVAALMAGAYALYVMVSYIY